MKQTFREKLRQNLRNVLAQDELSILPKGYQQVGSVVILNLDKKLWVKKQAIASQVKKLISNCKTVCLNVGEITGQHRMPQVELLIGDSTETQHKEHGTIYEFDCAKIMFSKGNINERRRIPELVRDGEIVFDFFAGIGYFSLNIARFANPEQVYAFEINPTSYYYLKRNIKLNKLDDKITPILGDCKIEAPKIGNIADRVIMGILPAPKDALPVAFQVLTEGDAFIHYEGLLSDTDEENPLFHSVQQVADDYNREIELLKVVRVKSFKPHVYHVVLDILVKKD
ncbi:MAG: class I SAM-dependent methyltransferase [Candidatus Helarchaeota archaeon]